MAILEIKKAGDPVLKQVAEPIDRLTKRHRQLLDDMAETMYSADGVGLAAPQVGKSLRIVVIDVQDEHGLLELVNPVITMREGSVAGLRRCGACGAGDGGVYGSAQPAAVSDGGGAFGALYSARVRPPRRQALYRHRCESA